MSRLFAAKDQALLLNPQETQNYEGWVRDRHGGKRSVLFAKRVFYDEFNELAGIVGAFLDITDRQQAEYNLRLRERAIDASNEGICLIGSVFNDSPLLYVNQGFEQLTGYSRQEVLGRNMRFLQGPKTEAEAVGQLRAAALSGQPISLELINYRKDGTPFWNRISLTPTRDEETNTLLWVAVLTDVSGQRQIERALRRRETELATIQDHAPFLLCLLCKDHKLLQCNKTFTDFVKRPEIQLAGKPICAALGCEVDFKPTAGQRPECVSCSLLKAIQVSLAGPQKNAMLEQVLTLRNGGRTRAYTFLASVAFLKLDNSPRVLLCLEDITLRKEAELQLFESRQMLQALSRRLVEAAEIARRAVARDLHDLVGQNLTLININLGIIRNELLRAPASDALSRLEDSMRLVDETMDHVRNVIADLRPAVLDDYGLAAALRWSCEQLETRTGLHIEMENSSEFPRLEAAVEVAVYRIVQEALTNVVRHARAKTVRIELRRAATGTQIVVRDDGVGFVPAKLFSDSFPNTWGLATMRERAEGIGAQWRLRSAPGQGTEIVIDFSPPASP
jgi:PAS domain S-box-containing protein